MQRNIGVAALWLLFEVTAFCMHAQSSKGLVLNQFDSLGYMHGYWEQWMDYSWYPTTKKHRATLSRLILYDHGVLVHIFGRVESSPGSPNYRVFYIPQGGSPQELTKNKSMGSHELVNGKIVAIAPDGDTLRTEHYSHGIPYGIWIGHDSVRDYVSFVVDFHSDNVMHTSGYEFWEAQEGSGDFIEHGIFDKRNGLWGHYSALEGYAPPETDRKRVFVVVHQTGTMHLWDGILLVNDSLLIDFSERSLADFTINSDVLVIRSHFNRGDTRPLKEIRIENQSDTIAVRVNYHNGGMISLQQISVSEAISMINTRKYQRITRYQPEKSFILDKEREKPYTKRQQKRILRRMEDRLHEG